MRFESGKWPVGKANGGSRWPATTTWGVCNISPAVDIGAEMIGLDTGSDTIGRLKSPESKRMK